MAELIPEAPVAVVGFKSGIDGTGGIVTKVKHSLSDGGFATALEMGVKAEGCRIRKNQLKRRKTIQGARRLCG